MNINGTTMDVDGESEPPCLSSFVDRGSVQSHRYYLARRTVLEMLRDRGYAVPDSEIAMSLTDFRYYHGEEPDVDRLRIGANHATNPSNKILVIFCGPGVIKVKTIQGIFVQITNRESLNRLILIVESKMTSQAIKAMDLIKPVKVELFQITDLLVNITKHSLKPKQELLSDQEKEKLLKKYSLEEKQLPRMLQQDAIVRYYGYEKGQVIKVTYNSEVTESHVTYRCVW